MKEDKYEEYLQEEYNYCVCKKCNEPFMFKSDNTFWDENGYSYSTKLVRCSKCGCINVAKYIEDYGFSKLNTDERLYK